MSAPYRLSDHAESELRRRGIPRELVDLVLARPQQIVDGYGGRKVLQSQFDSDEGRRFLLRVVVDETTSPAIVVTVYRTSRIGKYWRVP